ncbi:GNAT family N-acetyltransferase [Microterricola pindariensis]|uniref:N-acetyltransferase domain-containing protein n=1 Tax=Microterricola pindariensis TaxID=478010 RepID=A0ABX5AZK4_9MICO|nr:GNAT family N-acetyltransferase [Microterricola pindariensis]PPL19970.1 hypothetical protein GY24_03425 [Microterricola pindariensis]
MLEIRPYRPSDRAAVYDICVRTADAGGDARGQYSSDDLMPDVYAGPYLEYAPELVSIVASGDRAVGYLLAVADTADFVRWHRANWLPGFAQRYAGQPADAAEAGVVESGLHPERMLIAELDAYPAHLHIDLLPEAQGQGLGRVLIDGLRAALHERGVPGLHLGFAPQNVGAAAFYDRLGFHALPSSSAEAPLVGRATAS